MMRANSARVEWDQARNRWEVHIYVGAEVIKRPISKDTAESGDDALRAVAIETARDEGYEVDPANVTIEHAVA